MTLIASTSEGMSAVMCTLAPFRIYNETAPAWRSIWAHGLPERSGARVLLIDADSKDTIPFFHKGQRKWNQVEQMQHRCGWTQDVSYPVHVWNNSLFWRVFKNNFIRSVCVCVISSISISKIEPTSVQETTQKALKHTIRHAQEVRRAKKEPISSQHSLPVWC